VSKILLPKCGLSFVSVVIIMTVCF
jgi:hypothetical protein